MVDERTADGVRIAQLLASELTAGGGVLAALCVTDSDPDVAPTTDGALAYRVVAGEGMETPDHESAGDGETAAEADPDPSGSESRTRACAEVFVHPDRARVEFVTGPDAAARAAADAGLRVRPKAVRPPRSIVFVEDGAEVKRVLSAFAAAVDGSD